MEITPVILSGGSGKRLWPLSRKNYPKQYLKIFGEETLLQKTLLRLKGITNITDPIIICNDEHRFIVAEQCRNSGFKNVDIIIEPVGRNTAPAIAVASVYASKKYINPTLLVLSADHLIEDTKYFQATLKKAIDITINEKIVIFGIRPLFANTEYGYIRYSKRFENSNSFFVDKFIEKPNKKKATEFFENGGYFWNSGMFIFSAEKILKEFTTYSPEILSNVKESLSKSTEDIDFIRLHKESFKKAKNISIDFEIIEKTKDVIVIEYLSGWSDIGSWPSIFNELKKDKNGNAILGDVCHLDTQNSLIYSEDRMIVSLGISNVVFIDTPDVSFIGKIENMHNFSKIIQMMEDKNRPEIFSHRKVYRPWGWFDSISKGDFFQVKKLHINPKSKLSLQKHSKRAEHWVVVKGIATVINNNERIILNMGDSTYIPLGVTHSLENNENSPLEVIEIQSGTYLGEDDIVRYEDIYGRIKE